jgi:hypothetical protein
MHRASLRTQLVKTYSPSFRAQPSPHLALLARFCQTGKSGQVNKQGAGFEDKGHIKTEAYSGASKQSQRRLTPIPTAKKCPPKQAKRENSQATEPCYIHLKLLTGETQCRNYKLNRWK